MESDETNVIPDQHLVEPICPTSSNNIQTINETLAEVSLNSICDASIVLNDKENETAVILDSKDSVNKDEGISDCSSNLSERGTSSPEIICNKEISPTISDDSVNECTMSLNNVHIEEKSDKEVLQNGETRNEIVENCHAENELQVTVMKQRIELERALDHIKHLEQVTVQQGLVRAELEARFQNMSKHYELAMKEKEATVIRYAVSEKNNISQKNAKEAAEKQLKEVNRENELLTHKLSLMSNEKARICQLLDNKCHELSMSQKECEKLKFDLSSCENKLKWTQNNLRVESEGHREKASQIDSYNSRLHEASVQVEQAKREAQEAIRTFKESQENRAHVLDQQLKEQAANLILVRHERDDREQQNKHLQSLFDKLNAKHQSIIDENNTLSIKVQQLEKERLENEKKLSELREYSNQQHQNATDLQNTAAQLEQVKLQLINEQEQNVAIQNQIEQLKQRNAELQSDMDNCRSREAEMLHFTQLLTEKNVRLQSEFSTLETKVQQLSCEQTTLRRTNKELETRLSVVTQQYDEEKRAREDETKSLRKQLTEKTSKVEQLLQEVDFQKGENLVLRRKMDTSLKELTKELQQSHKRIEHFELTNNQLKSHSSSNSSVNTVGLATSSEGSSPQEDNSKHDLTVAENGLDKQTLLSHLIRLQRASARKSEKIDFLEEHVQTLVTELQRKSRLLQHYMIREQTGTLSSDTMEQNKAEIAKSKGVMASMYSSRIADETLTLELSLDINKKLQALLEDTLLKNITLKESVDTLGTEIQKLMTEKKS